jgi:cytochrome c oxidase assembly protein subunit 15
LVVHFIHRNLAYIITLFIFVWWWKTNKTQGTAIFKKIKALPLLIVLLQLLLGVFTVLHAATPHSFLWLAVAHQFAAMLLLLSLIWMFYIVRSKGITVL